MTTKQEWAYTPEHYLLEHVVIRAEDDGEVMTDGVYLKVHDDNHTILNAFGPLPKEVYWDDSLNGYRFHIPIEAVAPCRMWEEFHIGSYSGALWRKVEDITYFMSSDIEHNSTFEPLAFYALSYDYMLYLYDEAPLCRDAS